mmetsp:Transcript_19946/g.49007  ORF Transcript_19946/g.49007 Transcript_19946/m.49007 type:complete len:135 (-) Transcript_19946:1536-1940(-)
MEREKERANMVRQEEGSSPSLRDLVAVLWVPSRCHFDSFFVCAQHRFATVVLMIPFVVMVMEREKEREQIRCDKKRVVLHPSEISLPCFGYPPVATLTPSLYAHSIVSNCWFTAAATIIDGPRITLGRKISSRW